MQAIGVRELKGQASEVLRRVREHGETIAVTYRGRVVAHIVPAGPSSGGSIEREELDAIWTDLDRLAAEIGARWPANVTAAESVREGRRDL